MFERLIDMQFWQKILILITLKQEVCIIEQEAISEFISERLNNKIQIVDLNVWFETDIYLIHVAILLSAPK